MNQAVLEFLKTLRQTQFLPREQVILYQRRLLEPLMRHARAHVPFYRDSGRLAPLFRPNDTINWERWHEIPPLSRKEVQGGFEALKSAFLPPEHGSTRIMTTSGSTGEPVKVVQTSLAGRVAWTAQALRDLERHAVDPKRRLVVLTSPKPGLTDASAMRRRREWYPGLSELGMPGERIELADTAPATELIERVVALRPTYLQVQPIALQLMCANDRDARLADLGIEAVMTIGDRFPAEAKREVALHLGSRIIDHYASQECGRIATGCPHCARFHVDAEVHRVEVIAEDGTPTPEGQVGRVLVTPLYNYAMPLIRYDHADQARVGTSHGCPVSLPVLDEVLGKERMPFVFPNGETIRPTVSTQAVVDYLGAQAYQIVQTATDRCEVRIVPGQLSRQEMHFEEMTGYLRSIWWEGLEVEYRIVESLASSPQGKLPLFVRNFPTEGAAS